MSFPSHRLAIGILAVSSFAPATIHGQPVEKPAPTPIVATASSPSTDFIEQGAILAAGAVIVWALGSILTGNNRRNCSHEDLDC